MGLTPLEGLVMGTRSGDLDPAVLAYLQAREYHPAIGRFISVDPLGSLGEGLRRG